MIYLLDTHTWIWWNMEPKKLSRKARSAIEDTQHYSEILLSAISPWEFCKLLEFHAQVELARCPSDPFS